MNGRAPFRLLAAILGMIAALAIPGEALAHGHAHHEHASTNTVRAAQDAPRLLAADTDGDHPHPAEVSAVRSVHEGVAYAVPGTTSVPAGPFIVAPANLAAATPARQPGDPWPGPPARVRAPPIG